MKQSSGSRLLTDPLTRWLGRAAELDIYVRYTVEGEGVDMPKSGDYADALLDRALGEAVTACEHLDAAERWLVLHLDIQPERILLELAGPGQGPDPPPPGTVGFARYDDSYELRLEMTNECRGGM